MIVIGVDPGKLGALAFLGYGGEPRAVLAMPVVPSAKGRDEYDERHISDLIEAQADAGDEPCVVYEQLQPLPPKMGGGVANFQRGLAVGLLRGLCAGLGVQSMAFRPQEWQREMLAGTSGEDTKQRAIVAAGRLFPGVCLVCLQVGGLHEPHGRRTKARDGAADALLIAEFARRRLAGQVRAVAS